jgi:hypothetical protein
MAVAKAASWGSDTAHLRLMMLDVRARLHARQLLVEEQMQTAKV